MNVITSPLITAANARSLLNAETLAAATVQRIGDIGRVSTAYEVKGDAFGTLRNGVDRNYRGNGFTYFVVQQGAERGSFLGSRVLADLAHALASGQPEERGLFNIVMAAHAHALRNEENARKSAG